MKTIQFYYDNILPPAVESFYWACIAWYGLHDTPPVKLENKFWGSLLPAMPSVANLNGLLDFTRQIENQAKADLKVYQGGFHSWLFKTS